MTKARNNAYGYETLGTTQVALGSTATSVANLELSSPKEFTTVTSNVPGAVVNFDFNTQGVYYSTGTTTTNVTLNFRGNSSNTLASQMAVGDAWSAVFMMTNGSTPYYVSSITVDGATSSVTMKWSGGTAPSAGNASAVDSYSFTIIKTATTPAYTVFAGGPVKFA